MTQAPTTQTSTPNDQKGPIIMTAKSLAEAQTVAITNLPAYTTATTREAYLAWVVQWKAVYKGLTEAIRALKPMRKETRAEFDPSAAWLKSVLRNKATNMLAMRAQAKEWAIAQRDAKLAAEAAPAEAAA